MTGRSLWRGRGRAAAAPRAPGPRSSWTEVQLVGPYRGRSAGTPAHVGLVGPCPPIRPIPSPEVGLVRRKPEASRLRSNRSDICPPRGRLGTLRTLGHGRHHRGFVAGGAATSPAPTFVQEPWWAGSRAQASATPAHRPGPTTVSAADPPIGVPGTGRSRDRPTPAWRRARWPAPRGGHRSRDCRPYPRAR